jgi:DNA-binding Xre family transcriptional regulator
MNTTKIPPRKETRMDGTLVSKIPDLMLERKVNPMDLIRKGLAMNTAYRAARGETDFTLGTLAVICDVLDADGLDDLIEYVKNDR